MIFVHSLLDRIWCRTALHLALAPRQTKPIIYDWSTFFMRWIILLIRCWCWTVDWRRSRIDYNLCITRQFSNNAMIRAFNVLMSSQFTVSSAALSFNRIQSKPIESQISSHGDYCDALILFFFLEQLRCYLVFGGASDSPDTYSSEFIYRLNSFTERG